MLESWYLLVFVSQNIQPDFRERGGSWLSDLYAFEEIVWVLEYFKREILEGLLCINVSGYMTSLDIVFEGSVCNKFLSFFIFIFFEKAYLNKIYLLILIILIYVQINHKLSHFFFHSEKTKA